MLCVELWDHDSKPVFSHSPLVTATSSGLHSSLCLRKTLAEVVWDLESVMRMSSTIQIQAANAQVIKLIKPVDANRLLQRIIICISAINSSSKAISLSEIVPFNDWRFAWL